MKSKQDFTLFVLDGTIVPHQHGSDIGKKKRFDVKAGEEIPSILISHLMMYHKDYLDNPTPIKKKKKESKKVDSYDDLKALKKAEQVELIKELGGKTIPPYEKGRIKLIQKLQGD